MDLKQMLIRKNELQAKKTAIVKAALHQAEEESADIDLELTPLVRKIADTINGHAATVRKYEKKDYGRIGFELNGVKCKHEVQKKVNWDEAQLSAIYDQIEKSGDDPKQYIKTKLSVEEKKFQAWPKIIQKKFTSARTEKPGPAKIVSIEIEDDE